MAARPRRAKSECDEDWETPLVPPTVAVEIRSPDDRQADLGDTIATLLRAGTDLVLVVDPRARTVTTYERSGERVFGQNETFEHSVLPGFTVPLRALFAEADQEPPR
ncbi:MAG TPA: Uma2 family endonuclease [Candidatus Elarobacter sp.]